jgi:hypothetical protein
MALVIDDKRKDAQACNTQLLLRRLQACDDGVWAARSFNSGLEL